MTSAQSTIITEDTVMKNVSHDTYLQEEEESDYRSDDDSMYNSKIYNDPIFNVVDTLPLLPSKSLYDSIEIPSNWKNKYLRSEFRYTDSIINENNKTINIPKEINASNNLFYVLFIGLMVIIVLALIYFFTKIIKDINWKSERIKKIGATNASEDINIDHDIQALDMPSLIQEAKSNGNYRLAIRYYFIWHLQSLQEHNYISYDKDKTNDDYRNELTNPKLLRSFNTISYLYENVWYGMHDLDLPMFNKIETSIIQNSKF